MQLVLTVIIHYEIFVEIVVTPTVYQYPVKSSTAEGTPFSGSLNMAHF